MSCTFPRLDHKWQLVGEGEAPYITTRRKIALMCAALGDSNGEAYTLHSPKNLSSASSNQMSFGHRELAIIGHWSSTSRMPERYDRSVCASELLLRNTIIQQIVAGWNMAPSYRLPATATGRLRIGKTEEQCAPDPIASQRTDAEREVSPSTLSATQTSAIAPIDDSGEIGKTETTIVETNEQNPQQNTTQTEPKTDVLALGTQALDNPII